MPKRSAKLLASANEVRHAASGEYRIDGAPGLLLTVNGAGKRSWVARYRSPLDGKPRRMGLGAFPAVPLASARDRALAIDREVSAKRDPIAEKAERTRAITVEALCEA